MEKYMEKALIEAQLAKSIGEVPVGCIFIYNNNIIANGGNLVNLTKNATRHAELICIDKVLEYCKLNSLNYNTVFQEITVIVTVEPCIMCLAALNNLNIKEILYGCKNDRFGGTTVLNVEKILNCKIPIRGGISSDEAMALLKEFYKGENPAAPVPKKCGSIFVREHIVNLSKMQDCTVVKGNIIIAVIRKNHTQANYDEYKFPKLREVTEFVLIYDVKGLETLGNMFPNLAIIRGERLFENYALGIFEMHNLKELGLKSLITIPKGHVFIDRCPHLCNAHMINWDVMTKSYGSNHIQKIYVDNCPNCKAYCPEKYCWGPNMCQLNDTINLSDMSQNTAHCHSECLFGCYGPTDLDCVVCKNFNDNRKCVTSCPHEKYTHFDDKRCYNEAECLQTRNFLFEDINYFRECIKNCPYGYIISKHSRSMECKKCKPIDKCSEMVCEGGEIQYLQDAQFYKGCKIINGSLEIKMDGRISEKLLKTYLGDIKIIKHYLKIYNMPHIHTLQFLNNLEQIHGEGLENELFGLLIYDNRNLTKLWTTRKKVNIINGGIYIHSNDNLCNHEVVRLQENLEYDKGKSHITFNEEEIYCSLPTIFANYTVLSHNSVQIIWKNSEILKNTEVFYREVKDKDLTIHNSSNETIGFKFIWKREKLPNNIYFDHGRNYLTYNIKNLKQNTKYELLIKTFGEMTENQFPEKQSNICTFKTYLDYPKSPKIKLNNKTNNSITLEWNPKEYEQHVTNYIIEIFMKNENKTYLDTRDYCQQYYQRYSIEPSIIKFQNPNDSCTYEKSLEQIDNDEFDIMINKKFTCSDENLKNCNENDKIKNQQINNYVQKSDSTFENIFKLQVNQTKFLIANLKHYTLYIFKLYACNQKGCGSYSLYHERTLPSRTADTVNNIIIDRSSDNPNKIYVNFHEPKNPNGIIVAYQILLRHVYDEQEFIDYKNKNPNEYMRKYPHFNGTEACITRVEHENNNNKFLITLDKFGYLFTVRALSLSGRGLLANWQPIELKIVNVSRLGTTAIIFVTIIGLIIFFLSVFIIIKYIRCECFQRKLPKMRFRFLVRSDDSDILLDEYNSIEMSEEIQRVAY